MATRARHEERDREVFSVASLGQNEVHKLEREHAERYRLFEQPRTPTVSWRKSAKCELAPFERLQAPDVPAGAAYQCVRGGDPAPSNEYHRRTASGRETRGPRRGLDDGTARSPCGL